MAINDSTYNRMCLSLEEPCTTANITKAAYDYVGAVYGDVGEVIYDGKLAEAEMQYVKSTFGELTIAYGQHATPDDLMNYFARAKSSHHF